MDCIRPPASALCPKTAELSERIPNSPDCYIVIDSQKYYWKEGEAVLSMTHTPIESRTATMSLA
jgi:hypothetical protein